jgi:predicted SprT family Zn-dependent metalloprotease
MTQQPNQLDLVPTPHPAWHLRRKPTTSCRWPTTISTSGCLGAAPSCLITLQREKRTFGYFSAARFASLDGSTTDEIAMNPTYFAVVPIIETLQTQVHEMTHLWQHHFGKPGRGRYHNEEWARKMESIGLMPSSTGQPGGARTGDSMADYAVEGGRFLAACHELLTANFTLSWYDRFLCRSCNRWPSQHGQPHSRHRRDQASNGQHPCPRRGSEAHGLSCCRHCRGRRSAYYARQQIQSGEIQLQRMQESGLSVGKAGH